MSRKIVCPDDIDPSEGYRKWNEFVVLKHRDMKRDINREDASRSLVNAYSKEAYIAELEARAVKKDLNAAQHRIHRQRIANRELVEESELLKIRLAEFALARDVWRSMYEEQVKRRDKVDIIKAKSISQAEFSAELAEWREADK